MASFNVYGVDELHLAFQKSAQVPVEVKKNILKAMGEEGKKAIAAEGAAKQVRDPESDVHVLETITLNDPNITDSGGSLSITFKGTRKRGKKKTRNAEIAFINEFGKKNTPAKNFIKTGLDKYANKISGAGEKVFDDWLDNLFKK